MDKLKSNQVLLQLIVAFILTLLTAIYTLTMLTDALNGEHPVKAIFLSLGLLILFVIDFYIAYRIVKTVKATMDELEDS